MYIMEYKDLDILEYKDHLGDSWLYAALLRFSSGFSEYWLVYDKLMLVRKPSKQRLPGFGKLEKREKSPLASEYT